MRTTTIVVATVLTCLLAATCDDPPSSPQRPTPIPNPTPTPAPQPALASLELTGQTTLAPGATSEFTLMAVFSDGTRTDVTGTAQWGTTNSNAVTTLGQGRFRAVAFGEAFINARYSTRNVSREIVVVPDGTFRVIGRVVEADGGTPIANVHVRVRDGEGTGPSADADASGFYRLYGVKRDTDFSFTQTGYADTDRRVTIDRHSTVNISMPLTGPRLKVDGTHTVTFTWSNCSNSFPNDLRQRVYTADVKQAGAEIELRFTEPSFVHNSANRGDLMQGRVSAAGMYLFADSGYYYGYYGAAFSPSLIEQLPDSYRLVSWGTAFLTASGNRFSGPMQGGATLSRRLTQSETFVGSCSAGNIVVERR